MEIKGVLLDLDDTLWPVAPVIAGAEQVLQQWIATHLPQVAADYSTERLRQRRQALVPTDPRFEYDLWALRLTLLQQVFAEYGKETMAAQAMDVFAHARNQVALYDDVRSGLQALAERFDLGTVSNGFADLQAIGLAPFFRVSIAARQYGAAKPAAGIFHAACAELRLEPGQVLYVGDDPLLDVQGAQQAGLRAAWMNRHGRDLLSEQHVSHVKPDIEVSDLHDLLQKL